MASDKWNFGSSWLGIIFNPVGYMAQRKSVSKAAQEYYRNNPVTTSGNETPLQLSEYKQSWVNGCASKLKSDDKGKSLANATTECTSVFEESPAAKISQSFINIYESWQASSQAASNRKNTMTIFYIVLLCIVIISTVLVIKRMKN